MMEIGREIEDKREWIGGLGDGKGRWRREWKEVDYRLRMAREKFKQAMKYIRNSHNTLNYIPYSRVHMQICMLSLLIILNREVGRCPSVIK